MSWIIVLNSPTVAIALLFFDTRSSVQVADAMSPRESLISEWKKTCGVLDTSTAVQASLCAVIELISFIRSASDSYPPKAWIVAIALS